MKKLITLFFLCIIFVDCNKDDDATSSNDTNQKTLILVSLDGFRHDYFDFTDTPAIDQIASEGVKAAALLPVFPTKNLPQPLYTGYRSLSRKSRHRFQYYGRSRF